MYWPCDRVDIAARRVGFARRRLPIERARDDLRLERVLNIFQSAIVIAVGMRDYQVFDIGRIEVHFPEAVFDLGFRRVIEKRVNEDNGGGRSHRPRSMDLRAKVVETLRPGPPRPATGVGAATVASLGQPSLATPRLFESPSAIATLRWEVAVSAVCAKATVSGCQRGRQSGWSALDGSLSHFGSSDFVVRHLIGSSQAHDPQTQDPVIYNRPRGRPGGDDNDLHRACARGGERLSPGGELGPIPARHYKVGIRDRSGRS